MKKLRNHLSRAIAMIMLVLLLMPVSTMVANAASYPILFFFEDENFEKLIVSTTATVGDEVKIRMLWYPVYKNEEYEMTVYDEDGDAVATASGSLYNYDTSSRRITVTWDTSDEESGRYRVVVVKKFYSLYRWNEAPSTSTLYINLEEHVHSFGAWKTTKEATCTEAGTQTRTCLCGEKETRGIRAKGHSFSAWKTTKEATCTEAGTQTRTCSCGEKETRGIRAKGHSFGAWKTTKEATTQSAGEKVRVCSICNTKETAKIAKLANTGAKDPNKDLYGNTIVTESQKEKAILAQTNDNDPTGSTFSLLQAKAKKTTKTSVKLTWKKIPGATAYVIYGNRCGKGRKYQKLVTVSGTSYTQKGLRKGTYYKYLVVATGSGKALATSKTIHAATTGGKVGNAKSVKVKKSKFTLKVGKTVKIKAKAVPKSKKLKVKKHRKLAYETSDPTVATVNKSGKIKAVGKGKCVVYVYAQNGVSKAIKVQVK